LYQYALEKKGHKKEGKKDGGEGGEGPKGGDEVGTFLLLCEMTDALFVKWQEGVRGGKCWGKGI